jgi:hypothetical protein
MGDYPIRQLILHTRILVGWFSWELNPEVLGSSWLKASATWGRSLRLKASVMGRRAVPLFSLCPGIRLTTEEKHGESQGSRAARGLLVAPTWLSFEGLPRLACWTSDRHGFPGDFSQPAVGTGAFRVAVLRGSPQLWCGRRRMESPNPREFACYQRTKVRW